MTVADKLLQLNQVKQDIKAAIENKGVDLTGVTFTDYANKISDISSGDGEAYDEYALVLYYRLGKLAIFENAWEHSLTVDPLEISANSSLYGTPKGRLQYPNGETEGVIIPQGVTNIGKNAFRNWQSNNQPLVIPNSVTSIDDYAFLAWYSNNHPLVIPEGVESMGLHAFGAWSLVPYVEMKSITPPAIADANAFNDQNNAPIYVPDESVDAYKTATNWVNLASRIFSINDK